MTDNADSLSDILVCPRTRTRLVRDGDRLVNRDPQTRLAYPIRDGIPNMLADEALTLEPDEWQAIMDSDAADSTGESA